jgi:cation transport ATPase
LENIAVRRAVELVGAGLTLELSKVTAVRTKQKMIHFDELPDGTWRLIYNGEQIPDFSKITEFKIVREN